MSYNDLFKRTAKTCELDVNNHSQGAQASWNKKWTVTPRPTSLRLQAVVGYGRVAVHKDKLGVCLTTRAC